MTFVTLLMTATTPYVCKSSLEFVLEKLEEYFTLAMEWLQINEMKLNADTFHSFISGNKFEQMWARIRDDMLWENRTAKLLGITTQSAFTRSKLTIETLEQGKICLKLTIKIPERRYCLRSGVFIVNFEHISHFLLLFLLLTLSK